MIIQRFIVYNKTGLHSNWKKRHVQKAQKMRRTLIILNDFFPNFQQVLKHLKIWGIIVLTIKYKFKLKEELSLQADLKNISYIKIIMYNFFYQSLYRRRIRWTLLWIWIGTRWSSYWEGIGFSHRDWTYGYKWIFLKETHSPFHN